MYFALWRSAGLISSIGLPLISAPLPTAHAGPGTSLSLTPFVSYVAATPGLLTHTPAPQTTNPGGLKSERLPATKTFTATGVWTNSCGMCNGMARGYVALNWLPVTGARSYVLYRDKVLYKSALTGTEYLDMGARPGKTYTYTLAAVPRNGVEGSHSTPASAMVPSRGLVAPTNLRIKGVWMPASAATTAYQTDTLTWDAAPGAVSYNVYQYDTRIATGVQNASYTVPKANFIGGLTYTVTTVDAMGMESIPSNLVMTQGAFNPLHKPGWTTTPPLAPYALVATPEWNNGAPRTRLHWQADGNARTYDVYRDGNKIASGLWGQSYLDMNAVIGVTYNYSVSAVNVPWTQPVESARSAPVSATPRSAPLALQGEVAITQITLNDDSVVVTFSPVPGATDYRAYNKATPGSVKYSGGSLSVEVNGLKPGEAATLVVEAVDKLGPYQKMDGEMGPGSMNHEGMTMAINGQGDPSNIPNIIATSAPFVVIAQAPPRLTGDQVFFDTFRGSQPLVRASVPQPLLYENNKQVGAVENDKWVIYNVLGDLLNTRTFIMSNHLMETLYDGGTPGRAGNALHTDYASIVMQPKATADISGDKVLHVTFEVDPHFSARRWCDVMVTAAGDPLLNPNRFLWNNVMPTVSGNVFRWQIKNQLHEAEIVSGKNGAGNLSVLNLFKYQDRFTPFVRTTWDGKPLSNGSMHDIDKRHRFDLYLSANRFQVYESGQLIKDSVFPGGARLPFSHLQVYFMHGVYHTSLGRGEMIQYSPKERYWINHRPVADERHWDNMGFEVLGAFPATAPR